MRGSVAPISVIVFLGVPVAAVVLALFQAEMSLSMAFGVGFGLTVLCAVIASDELALYLMVFSMLLSPEIMVGRLGGGTTLGRGLTLRFDDFLTVIVGVTWLAKTALHKELGLVFSTPLNRPIAAYAFAALFATGLGMIAGRVTLLGGSLFVLKYIQYFVIYFMAVNNLHERNRFERFLWALLGTAAVASVIGILQIPSGERVSAPFEGDSPEPNTFGGYLVLMLALVAGLFLTSETFRRKAVLSGLAALIILPLLFTLSRASYLALIPMAIALFWWSDRKRLLGAIFALSLAIVPLVLPRAVVDRVLYTIAQPPEAGQVRIGVVRLDTSTSERVNSWTQAILYDWPRHPIFGWGVTGYRFLDTQYARTLVETGLLGLTTLLWLQSTLLRQLLEIYRGSQDLLLKGVALGLIVGLIGLLIHSIGSNTFIIVRIMEPFWFLVGMVMKIPEIERPAAVPRGKWSAARSIPAGAVPALPRS